MAANCHLLLESGSRIVTGLVLVAKATQQSVTTSLLSFGYEKGCSFRLVSSSSPELFPALGKPATMLREQPCAEAHDWELEPSGPQPARNRGLTALRP